MCFVFAHTITGDFLKSILKKGIVIFVCGMLFFGVVYAFLYFNYNQSETTTTDQKEHTVPYERLPENKGIAIVFSDGSAHLIQLDFDTMCIRLVDISEFAGQHADYNGYFADFTVKIDYNLVEGIIDRVGGIDLEYGGAIWHCTGTQVVEYISYNDNNELRRQIILKIFEQISKNDFSKDDFVYIIENSTTDLSLPDCIFWIDYIKQMSSRTDFIN